MIREAADLTEVQTEAIAHDGAALYQQARALAKSTGCDRLQEPPYAATILQGAYAESLASMFPEKITLPEIIERLAPVLNDLLACVLAYHAAHTEGVSTRLDTH